MIGFVPTRHPCFVRFIQAVTLASPGNLVCDGLLLIQRAGRHFERGSPGDETPKRDDWGRVLWLILCGQNMAELLLALLLVGVVIVSLAGGVYFVRIVRTNSLY